MRVSLRPSTMAWQALIVSSNAAAVSGICHFYPAHRLWCLSEHYLRNELRVERRCLLFHMYRNCGRVFVELEYVECHERMDW